MAELKLTQISIYPVKSLGGISLSQANVLGKGLQYDRRWMLVDKNGTAMTQRTYPAMALFKLSLGKDQLSIRLRDHCLDLPLENQALLNPLQVNIWDDTVAAFEVSFPANEWFSDLLGVECKLVYFPEQNRRPVNPKYSVNDEQVSLADAYPFLIIGQSTFDELNGRLTDSVPINRFRPNFVFTGGQPFEEDGWRNFRIGSVRFVGVKLCDRCVLTTVNQDTAEKGTEPLRTLATYRKKDNKIYFGQNLVTLDLQGTVSVGDLIKLE
jgi:uncharacterized protein YcbX